MPAQALRDFYAAINRNDIPAAVRVFDPEIEWIEPPDYPNGRTHSGLAVVQELLSQARGTWAEGTCQVEQLIEAGDKVVVFLYVRVRLKYETQWREGPQADVFTFRDGKAVETRIFADREQALEWAGVKAA